MSDSIFTPTQQKMLDVLSDGGLHRREELHACLPDELGGMCNVKAHLCNVRRILRDSGQDILYYGESQSYRWVYAVPISQTLITLHADLTQDSAKG